MTAYPADDVVARALPLAATVRVGPFSVFDRSAAEVVDHVVAQTVAASRTGQAWITYALHVGGLNARGDGQFVAAMQHADFVYADGMSVVVLAKLAGARRIERSGTTDLGWLVLRRLREILSRPPRVALVGGPDGLTRRAGEVLERDAGVEIVLAEHGYHADWTPVLAELRASRCDVLFVGLGAPKEMIWVEEHRDALPASTVITCGGWFGFVAETEKRAPLWAQRCGLEWTFRLAQAPGRMWRRYAQGVVSTAVLALGAGLHRPVVR